jgi:hypothetical protein
MVKLLVLVDGSEHAQKAFEKGNYLKFCFSSQFSANCEMQTCMNSRIGFVCLFVWGRFAALEMKKPSDELIICYSCQYDDLIQMGPLEAPIIDPEMFAEHKRALVGK